MKSSLNTRLTRRHSKLFAAAAIYFLFGFCHAGRADDGPAVAEMNAAVAVTDLLVNDRSTGTAFKPDRVDVKIVGLTSDRFTKYIRDLVEALNGINLRTNTVDLADNTSITAEVYAYVDETSKSRAISHPFLSFYKTASCNISSVATEGVPRVRIEIGLAGPDVFNGYTCALRALLTVYGLQGLSLTLLDQTQSPFGTAIKPGKLLIASLKLANDAQVRTGDRWETVKKKIAIALGKESKKYSELISSALPDAQSDVALSWAQTISISEAAYLNGDLAVSRRLLDRAIALSQSLNSVDRQFFSLTLKAAVQLNHLEVKEAQLTLTAAQKLATAGHELLLTTPTFRLVASKIPSFPQRDLSARTPMPAEVDADLLAIEMLLASGDKSRFENNSARALADYKEVLNAAERLNGALSPDWWPVLIAMSASYQQAGDGAHAMMFDRIASPMIQAARPSDSLRARSMEIVRCETLAALDEVAASNECLSRLRSTLSPALLIGSGLDERIKRVETLLKQ
jgi:hypothetical protein